jgi:hypothetical protein
LGGKFGDSEGVALVSAVGWERCKAADGEVNMGVSSNSELMKVVYFFFEI